MVIILIIQVHDLNLVHEVILEQVVKHEHELRLEQGNNYHYKIIILITILLEVEVVDEVKKTIPRIHLLFTLDTLKYLALGGRIGKAKALLGSVLNVKPILAIKDGEVLPGGQVRSRSKSIDRLVEFAQSAPNIEELAIVYNTTPDEAEALTERISSMFPKERIRLARLGPLLGVHAGPRALAVAYSQKE